MKEEWKPISGFEDLYEVSNMGRVKSLAREVQFGRCSVVAKKDAILKAGVNDNGYMLVILCKNGSKKTAKIHILVWDAFSDIKRNGRKLQIDHLDNNKKNNRFDNLQLLSQRENLVKYTKTLNSTSKYTGVSWEKERNKWRSSIKANGKGRIIGRFDNEHDAHLAYQKALKELD